jgi:acyl carrier protein
MGLESVEMVMEAERLFNVELPVEKVEKIYTFGAFVDCVHEANQSLGRKIEREDVYSTLRKVVSESLGVRERDITEDSRFIEDLGMN